MSKLRKTGEFVSYGSHTGSVRAFVPYPLPPNPPLNLGGALIEQMERANQSLGRLDSLARLLPNANLLVYSYIRKEAQVSSMIEGTKSTLAELLEHEAEAEPGIPTAGVLEVSSYVRAMEYGLQRLRTLPVSLRLIREIHRILLTEGRGSSNAPGEFRNSLVWIGGSRPQAAQFVPPPPDQLAGCLASLESFLHEDPQEMPPILKAALAHVQFETIHPFLDGNGRMGRLLITLLLCADGVLSLPILYLSLYFKQHRLEYYDRLTAVRHSGDWEAWVRFFYDGLDSTARESARTAEQVMDLCNEVEASIEEFGRARYSARMVFSQFKRQPIMSIRRLAEQSSLSVPTVTAALERLVDIGVLRETSGRRRGRLFAFGAYLDLLNAGTEPYE